MNQYCTRREGDNCRQKNIPIKFKTATNEFTEIHTFVVGKDQKTLNIDFFKTFDPTGKVCKNNNTIIHILIFFNRIKIQTLLKILINLQLN